MNLAKVVDGTSLGIFRIGFGLFMLWELFYFIRIDFVNVYLTTPQVNFPYLYFEFLKPGPSWLLQLIIYILIASTLLIIIGKYYRIAITTFFLGFTYLFLLDKAYYNNHLYLICLLSFLLVFIPADNRLSLAQAKSVNVKFWHLLVLRLQIALVYFFGGIAKINADWLLHKEPARAILSQKAASNSLFEELLTSEFLVNFIVYGGFIFDLCIGFFLFWKKTRKWAIIAAVLFNLTNGFLFDDINIFPYFMILSLVLFVSPEHVYKYVQRKWMRSLKPTVKEEQKIPISRIVMVGIGVYFLIQFLLPLRHLLYKGNTEWTGHGQRFAWRMKIQKRDIQSLEFRLKDMDKKIIYPIDFRSYALNRDQITLIAQDPYAAVQFAHFLKAHAAENKAIPNAQIISNLIVSMNGRTPQLIFPNDRDLSVQHYQTEETQWILPLEER